MSTHPLPLDPPAEFPSKPVTFPMRFDLSKEAMARAIRSATRLDVPAETVKVDPAGEMPEGQGVALEIPVSWVDGNGVDRTNRLRFIIGKDKGLLFVQVEGVDNNFPRG